MPPIQINGVSYDGEHAIRARVPELDAEHAGQPISGAAPRGVGRAQRRRR
jgi:hypothetical protein